MHAIPVAGHFGHKMAPKLRLSQLSMALHYATLTRHLSGNTGIYGAVP